MPSRFLASTFPFVIKHKAHSYIQELIQNSLKKYFEIQLLPIVKEKYDLHFVGSVANTLKDELNAISHQYGFSLKSIIKNPLLGLIEYHQKY
ncbi:MAG: hypothetical protein KatS3mg027_2060 [Bacteroidia bacterium]|nr:MAG: hypothetical protein KatS3mg027_2060 [Bacteroidia bacterium]